MTITQLTHDVSVFSGAKVALICDGQVITIQRDDKPGLNFAGMWDLPGGGREDDESPFETAKREVFEELDIDLDANCIVFQKEYPAMLSKNMAAYFLAGSVTKEQIKGIVFGDEGQGWKLIPVSELLNDDTVVPYLRSRLQDFIESPTSKQFNLV